MLLVSGMWCGDKQAAWSYHAGLDMMSTERPFRCRLCRKHHFREVTSHNLKELHVFKSLGKFLKLTQFFSLWCEKSRIRLKSFPNLLAIHMGCLLTLLSLLKSKSFMSDECASMMLFGLLCKAVFPLCSLPPSVFTFPSTDKNVGTH